MTGMVMESLAAVSVLLCNVCLSMATGGFVFGFVHANAGCLPKSLKLSVGPLVEKIILPDCLVL